MSRLKKEDVSKLNPSILKDESRKESHFFFKRIIDEDREGEVIGKEKVLKYRDMG